MVYGGDKRGLPNTINRRKSKDSTSGREVGMDRTIKTSSRTMVHQGKHKMGWNNRKDMGEQTRIPTHRDSNRLPEINKSHGKGETSATEMGRNSPKHRNNSKIGSKVITNGTPSTREIPKIPEFLNPVRDTSVFTHPSRVGMNRKDMGRSIGEHIQGIQQHNSHTQQGQHGDMRNRHQGLGKPAEGDSVSSRKI